MKAVITPTQLSGTVSAPPSKSVAHRLLICAAFANSPSTITLAASNDDIDATIGCLTALGARFEHENAGVLRVIPIPRNEQGVLEPHANATLDCKESGSTLRFLLPMVAALGCGASFIGQGRLAERPLSPLYECLAQGGVRLSAQGAFPLEVSGRLRKRVFTIAGNVSSQYISGILLAGPLMGVVTVHVLKPVESRPYINLTVEALEQFGVQVFESETEQRVTLRVSAGSSYHTPKELSVEGDWSAAAYWLCAGALGTRPIQVTGLGMNSIQGDRGLVNSLQRLGATFSFEEGCISAAGKHLIGCTLDVHDIPDLVPPLAAVAALAKGTTRITGAARLRLKESNRILTVSKALNALGAHVEPYQDGLVIAGVPELAGGRCNASGDHRIAMMAAIVAERCKGQVSIKGAECVSKSYPAFFDNLAALGGKVKLV